MELVCCNGLHRLCRSYAAAVRMEPGREESLGCPVLFAVLGAMLWAEVRLVVFLEQGWVVVESVVDVLLVLGSFWKVLKQ